MYSAGSVAPFNARDFSSPMPPDHISPVSASSAPSSWERQSYNSNSSHNSNSSRDRFPSSGKKELWSSEHRSSSQRYSSSSASFASNNKRRAPGFTGRHGTYENGRYGVAFSRQPDSAAIRSSENGKAERDTFILSGGYVSSPNADKYVKDIDGLHFRDTHISPVDVRAALSPQYDPSPRNGSQSSFEVLGSRDGERMKSASSRYSWSLNHRDQDFREKNVSRPDNYRRVCHLPKLDSSREWSVENKDVLEGRIDRYGSASNREPLYSEVYKDQSHKEWRNKDRGLYNGLPSRISSYPSKSHSRDLGIVSPRSEILGVTSLFEDQMVQNSQMHELNAEESVPNSKKRPRLTWGQGLAKYEKEKIEEDPSSQKKYDEVKILEVNPSCQKKSEDMKAEEDPSIQEKVVVDSEDHCKQNEGFQSHFALSCADQVVNADPHIHGEQCEAQELNQDLQLQVNISSDQQVMKTDTEKSDMQGQHYHIQGPCEQNGSLQSQFHIQGLSEQNGDLEPQFNNSNNEHTATADNRKNDTKEECGLHEPSTGHSTEEIIKALAMDHTGSSMPWTSVLHEYTDAINFTQLPNLESIREFIEKLHGSIPSVCNMVLMRHAKKVEIEIDSLEKQLITLENEQGLATGYIEKVGGDFALVKEIQKPDDENNVANPHPGDSCINSTLEPSDSPEMNNLPLTQDVPIEEIPYSAFNSGDNTVQKEKLDDELDQKIDKTMEHCRSSPKGTIMTSPGGISSEISSHVVSSLLLSNQETARQASDALAHLYPACIKLTLNEKRIYGFPQETDIWEYNAESHQKKRKILESKIAEKKKSLIFVERALVIKNRVKKELWKRGQARCLLKDQTVDPYLWSPEQKNVDAAIQPCPMIGGSAVAEADPEEIQFAKKFLRMAPVKEREFLRMPSMILGKDLENFHSFETNNALVEDPIAAERERKLMNPWSAEEKSLFLEKYLLLGKNLRKIASFLEHKTVADCVQFYYLNQKSEDFERVHRKHVLKKRRDSRSNALYLATTISSSRQREADAACMEGLSLVAAAAAAMSSSRVVRASLASSKTYRDRTSNKPVLGACVSLDKAGSVDQIVSKTPRSLNSRSYRGLNGDSESHWTDSERELFMKAIPMFGKDFHNISLYIGTKNQGQCKTFFSKARKKLGLDLLVEMYKAAVEAEKEQKLTTEPAGVFVEPNKHANAQASSADIEVQSAFLAGRIQSSIPCKEPVLGNTYSSSDLKSVERSNAHADHKGVEDAKATLCLGDASKQDKLAPDVDTAETIAANQVMPGVGETLVCGESKPDFLSVKAEPLVLSNLTNVPSNATPSLAHAIALPVLGPALAPHMPSVSSGMQSMHVIQPTHAKEKGSKGTETRTRREPTSWTQDEKDIFIDVLRTHGKNWERLRERLPGKSLTQIKTYFQNSKAKLTLECEGVISGNGRVSIGKRKADESDSSTNPGSGGQNVSRKAPIPFDDANLKAVPRVLDSGENATHVESLANSSRTVLEESSAQKSSKTAGLPSNPSPATVLPKLNAPVYGLPNPQNSYVSMVLPQPQQLLLPGAVTNSGSPQIVNQPHHLEQQQSISRAHEEILPFAPQLPGLQPLQPTMPSHPQVQGQTTESGSSFEWQKQQLQLAIDDLRQARKKFQQARSNHPVSPAMNQVLLTTSQVGGPHLTSTNNFSPTAYHSDVHQSQLYQINGNLQPPLTQQQEHVIQSQIMQLQWQQQHSQVQQVPSHSLVQADEAHGQSHHQTRTPLNEQQKMVSFKEFMRLSTEVENIRQHELDDPSLIRSQQSVSQYAHVPQCRDTAIASQAMADVQHVKLFGQSLFLPSDSSEQPVSNSSPPLTSSRIQVDDTNNAKNFGHSHIPPFTNGGSINEVETECPEVTGPQMSKAVAQSPEKNESQILDLPASKSDDVKESQVDSGALQDGLLADSIMLSCGRPTQISDIVVNRNNTHESVSAVSNGQPVVAQALPRVIDALVALAEWRLQNSSGGSGKLTDEFLSQSWEALQRDPSALLEVGKASESLAQLCSGGAEMLQQLKDGLIQRKADGAEAIKAGDIIAERKQNTG